MAGRSKGSASGGKKKGSSVAKPSSMAQRMAKLRSMKKTKKRA